MMAAPAFHATRFIRSVSLPIALYLSVIAISSMTMVKPAHASGSVTSTSTHVGMCGTQAGALTSVNNTASQCLSFTQTSRWWSGAVCHIGADDGTNLSIDCVAGSTTYYQAGLLTWTGYASSCPANSTGTSTCTCTDPYVADAAGTSCVLPACPVDKLTTPPFSDACSTSLEQGKGVDVNHACGMLREPDMVEAASCIAAKIHALNIPYTQPSATIRTTAYQNHLLEIWTKSQQLDTIMNSVVYTPETKQACVPRNVDVGNEKAQHGITHQPSSSGDSAPHVEYRAIDVPEAVIKALKKQVTTYTTTVTTVNGQDVITKTVASDVEDYMHSAPNACDPNLSWGGRFTPKDSVHFQLP